LFVAKRFLNIGHSAPVNPDQNRDNLVGDAQGLKQGQWFLKEFYNRCEAAGVVVPLGEPMSSPGLPVVDPSAPPSVVSSVEMDDLLAFDGVYWMVEPLSDVQFAKHCGSMAWPLPKTKLEKILHAFVHFVYEQSNKTVVVADIQSNELINGKAQSKEIVFDIMTHTPEMTSGVGDCGDEGIEAFLTQHQCQDLCQDLGLHLLNCEDNDGESDSDRDEEDRPRRNPRRAAKK
ncbi:kinase-like protein, partial [Sistotremastrum niveocremeum HHB9708]